MALATALELGWPVPEDTRVTSAFGWRTHPTLGTRRFHEGVDLAVPEGTSVYATGVGAVARAAEDAVSGLHVVVDHDYGVRSAYCHASALHVEAGEHVEAGDLILASGSTGRSTGPHLHYGLRIGGRPIDPAALRSADPAAALGGLGEGAGNAG